MNKNGLWDKLEQMKEVMGAETLLNEICLGLSSDELREALEYTDRMYELGIFDEKDEE